MKRLAIAAVLIRRRVSVASWWRPNGRRPRWPARPTSGSGLCRRNRNSGPPSRSTPRSACAGTSSRTRCIPRKGVTFKEMTEPQRALAQTLLKTGLSARGYLTAAAIMELEKVLGGRRRGEAEGRFPRDRTRGAYFISVFGTPGDKAAWGWRVEGHHISLRFDVVGGTHDRELAGIFRVESGRGAPSPGAAPKGTRVLGAEEDAARAVVDRSTSSSARSRSSSRRADRHPDHDRTQDQCADASGHQGQRADQGAA